MSVDGWQLDSSTNRDRYIRPKTEGTEMLSFRVVAAHARILDEIVHSGIDPRLKTKSDCLQDAVFMFIEDWAQHFGDGVPGRLRRVIALEQLALQREGRQSFIDNFDNELEQAKKSQDAEALAVLFYSLSDEISDATGFAPKSFVDALNDRMERMKALL